MNRFKRAVTNLSYVVDVMSKDIKWIIVFKSTDNFERFMKIGRPFHISEQGCNTSIYGNAIMNMKARAWHDDHHMKSKLPFDLRGEHVVCTRQKADVWDVLHKNGVPTRDIKDAMLLIQIDIVEQFNYFVEHDKFVKNQKKFVKKLFKKMKEV